MRTRRSMGFRRKTNPTQRTPDLKSDVAFTYTGTGTGWLFRLGMA